MKASFRDFTWIVVSVVVSFGLLGLSLVIGGMAGAFFGESPVVRLSVAAGVWPAVASLTTTALAWPMLDGRVRPRIGGPLLLIVFGSVASAVSAAALVMWADGHFGPLFDPEYVGPTLWLPVLAGSLTVGATWMLGLKGYPARFGALTFTAAGTLIALLALVNAPGLLDGVTAKGFPLMLAFASAGTVIVVGLGLTLRAAGTESPVSDRAKRGVTGPVG